MVCESNLFSDPLYNHTLSCLDYYNYSEALFTAERIFAENPNDESIFLLATCFYRCNRPKQAREFMLRHDSNSPKCRFLLAKCNMDIGNYPDAENTILGFNRELDNPSDVVCFYKELAPFVLCMLGEIYKMTDRRKYAISYLRKCLEISPLSWKAYTDLIDLNDNFDPTDAFKLSKEVVLNNHSCLRALSNKINIGDISHPNCPSKKKSDIHDSQEYLSVSSENVNPKNIEKSFDSVSSGDQLSYSFNCSIPHVNNNVSGNRFPSKFFPENRHNTSSKLSMYDSEDSALDDVRKPLFGHVYTAQLNTSNSFAELLKENKRNPEKVVTFDTSVSFEKPQKTVRNGSRISFGALPSGNFSTPIQPAPQKSSVRNTNSSQNTSIRKNSVTFSPFSPLVTDKPSFTDANVSGPFTRFQKNKSKTSASIADSKSSCSEINQSYCSEASSIDTEVGMQSTTYYLHLLTSMGRAYKFLKQNRIHESITQMRRLPRHHLHTALVSLWMGMAMQEKNEKQRACTVLSTSFLSEPWQLYVVPFLSNLYWTLNREVELSALALEMKKMDRTSYEVWCAFGNCMSFNRENEIALRYFQRVVQLEPKNPQGFLLMGHELLALDEPEKAIISYRSALALDPFSHNTLFHLSSAYQQMKNYTEAERLLREAARIAPDSYYILTNLAVAMDKGDKANDDEVLELLERVCRIYPTEPMCRFYKAKHLYKSGRYLEAQADLGRLEGCREARVSLLASEVHLKLGQSVQAVVCHSRSRLIDPVANDNLGVSMLAGVVDLHGDSHHDNSDIHEDDSISNSNHDMSS